MREFFIRKKSYKTCENKMKNKNPKLTSLFIFSEVIQWVPGPTYSVVTHLLMMLICIHLAFYKKKVLLYLLYLLFKIPQPRQFFH